MKTTTLLLTKTELAHHLRISDRQVDRIRETLPPPIKVGEQDRWSRATIETWIASNEPSIETQATN